MALRVTRVTLGVVLILLGVISGFIPVIQGWMLILAGLMLLAPNSRLARWTRLKLARARRRIHQRRKGRAARPHCPE